MTMRTPSMRTPHRGTPLRASLRVSVRTVIAAGTLAVAACGTSTARELPPPSDAAPLHEAVTGLSNVMVYDIFSPPQASRVYAYTSIAAYEVLRLGDTATFRSLAGQVNGLAPVPRPVAGQEVSLPLAAIHAFMSVGRQMTFSRARMDSLRTAMEQDYRRQRGISSTVFDQSLAYGDTVAKHILAWASKDGYAESRGMPKFSVTPAPGRWVPTPPAYMDAVEPNWMTLRPFVMDSSAMFKAEDPYPFDTTRTSRFMVEAREVYDAKAKLTDDQRAYVAFWDCNPYVMHVQGHSMFATKKITPGGHWMSIVGLASRKANADARTSAEAYARTAIALADGFISVWEQKFRSAVVRPETIINQYIDESWEPLLQTPPFPEYSSGHSGISTAAAVVLSDEFGPRFAFADSSEVPYGLPVRSFDSFEGAAVEAAISRLYGGIHYRHAIEQGQVQGRAVGNLVVARIHTRATPQVASRAR